MFGSQKIRRKEKKNAKNRKEDFFMLECFMKNMKKN